MNWAWKEEGGQTDGSSGNKGSRTGKDGWSSEGSPVTVKALWEPATIQGPSFLPGLALLLMKDVSKWGCVPKSPFRNLSSFGCVSSLALPVSHGPLSPGTPGAHLPSSLLMALS